MSVWVHTSPAYAIDIGLAKLADIVKSRRVLIVSQSAPWSCCGDMIMSHLHIDTPLCLIGEGEVHKNTDSLMHIYDALIMHKISRHGVLIALGGGVVGDVAGFAAATFMRGIDVVQIPTTLLAMVDSSVGGKTAINHRLGKNLIGAFWQPIWVGIEPNFLKTLPDTEFVAGLSEIIKYALIMDLPFLHYLHDNMAKILAKDCEVIAHIVRVSCAHKASIVSQDAHERGARALLNFGHTFAHALEAHSGYSMRHGEAVAIGMACALDLSYKMGNIDADAHAFALKVIACAGLPTYAPPISAKEWLLHMHHDKKVHDGRIYLILLRTLGDAYQTDAYDYAMLMAVLQGRQRSDL